MCDSDSDSDAECEWEWEWEWDEEVVGGGELCDGERMRMGWVGMNLIISGLVGLRWLGRLSTLGVLRWGCIDHMIRFFIEACVLRWCMSVPV